jgi:DNA repair protein RadC
MDYTVKLPIKQWSEDDRPREKLIMKGKMSLSNAELLAVLISSGNRKETALDIAKHILEGVNQNLTELSRLSVNELKRNSGIGTAKAVAIMAALELGNRKRVQDAMVREKIGSSRDVFDLFHPELSEANYEAFWILLLNRANRVIRKMSISEGGISGTVADPKKIFKMALEFNASSVILCHNHPSGNIQPSEADIKLTKKMKEAGILLDLPVLDHLIIGGNEYYSFADEGMM